MNRTTKRPTKVLRDRLAVHPGPANLVLDTLEGVDHERVDLVRIVQTDPALAAAVLRNANSVHLGFARQIVGIRQAIILLGHDVVEASIASRVADRVFSKKPVEYPSWLWAHSLSLASACVVLGRRSGVAPDEAYSLGLLHDVGWLLAASNHVDLPRHDRTHTKLGADLLARWNLPERFVAAIGGHHAIVDSSVGPLAKLLIAGHALVAEMGDSSPETVMSLIEALTMMNLHVKPSVLIDEVDEELASVVSVLEHRDDNGASVPR